MNERPQLRRKVTFKRRSNVIQLTTFFESLNQQYEQELKEQQEKKGSLAPEEEQKILSDSPYPFDFEEEEGDNEEQDSNTETESASEQQLNGPPSAERVAPSKKDVYPEKLNVKVTTVINSSSGDLKSETKKENLPTEVESNNNINTNHVEDDTVTNQSSSGKVANLKNVWELKQQQQEEEALKERQMRDLLRAQKEAAMIRRKSKPHDVHISAPITPNSPSTTSRPALIQPSPRPETPTVSPTAPEKTPKDKKPKSPKSPKSPRKPKDEAEDKNNHKTPNGVEVNGPSAVVTEPPAPQKPVPIEVESPKTISESVFSGNTKSQSDPILQSNTNDQSATGDELRNSMSTPNLPAQTDSGPTSMEVSTPKKSRDKDKDKKRDKDKDKDKTRTKTDSPKLKPKEKEKSRRSSSKKKDGEPENGLVGSSSGVNTNATNTPSKSGKEKNKDKDNKDKESIDKKIAEIESPSTKSHKRSSTDLYDKYNDTKPNKRNKTKRMLSANGVDGKSPKDKGRKKKKKKDPTIELTELKDSFARWKPTMLTHSWEIDGTDIEFIEKIGEGTSCSVYKGKFRNQIVALKVLKDLNDKQLDNFTKEFTIMSQFRSPDIVFFFGACIKPTPVMVLGYGERGSLYSVMKDPSTALTWPIVVKVLHQVVRGLHSLHNWKPQIVHRDLKSRNILVDNDWQTKLCDFGESRQLVGNNLETLCKMRGTYAYISPEVYFGQSFTPKSDVYAFAIVAWELVTKCIKGTYQPPYAEFKTLIYDFQIIVQAARRGIRPTIDKACPVALASMIHRCWNHIPDVRPSTDHLLKFLEEIMAESDPAKWINVPHVLEPPAYTMPPGGGPPPPSSTDREK